MHTLLKILLLVFITATFTSCLVRKPNHHNWSKRHHYKRYHHKGNNHGGRRLWVRYF